MALESVNGRQTFFGALPTENKFGGEIATGGKEKELMFTFSYDDLPSVDADNEMVAYLPSGAAIVSAHVKAKEAITGTTPTLTIGVSQADGGGVIDADGIDATIAEGALGLGDIVVCDGALIGAGAVAQERSVITATTGGTVTGGVFELTVRYIV